MKKVLMILSLLVMFAGLGCAALSHYVTPAVVDGRAVAYVVDAGIAEPNDYAGYPNLEKAVRLQGDVNKAHEVNLFEIEQMLSYENLEFGQHTDVTSFNAEAGYAREEAVFGEGGLLPLAAGLLGFGGFTGMIGLMRKRPGDVTRDEFSNALNQAVGESLEEIESKNKQLVQLVNGIGEFMNAYKGNDDVILALKAACDKAQDSDTKFAVQTIKKGIGL